MIQKLIPLVPVPYLTRMTEFWSVTVQWRVSVEERARPRRNAPTAMTVSMVMDHIARVCIYIYRKYRNLFWTENFLLCYLYIVIVINTVNCGLQLIETKSTNMYMYSANIWIHKTPSLTDNKTNHFILLCGRHVVFGVWHVWFNIKSINVGSK